MINKHLKSFILLFGIGCVGATLFLLDNKKANDGDYDQYYIVHNFSNNTQECYLKMPGSDEKYDGSIDRAQTRKEREITTSCEVILPPSFRKKYSICVLNGVSVDGLDGDNTNNLHRWTCTVDKTISSVSMSTRINATRSEVLCSMQCLPHF
ncbi:hypothetical protein LEWO105114_12215 [Legionella worsleiensis]|nr:Uncharacterised protein [Legionella worsleiensis]